MLMMLAVTLNITTAKSFNNNFPVINYFKSKKYKNKSTTWYDSELQTIYKTKQQMYKKFMKKLNEKNKSKYAQIRNFYDRLVKNKKQAYIQSKLVENKKNLKKNMANNQSAFR